MSSDAIAGVIGTLLGTILGWVLGILSQMGKIKLEFEDIQVEKSADSRSGDIGVSFLLRVINNKSRPFGMNSVNLYIINNKNRKDFGPNIFSDTQEINEFDQLLNIPAKETKEVRFQSVLTCLNPENMTKYKIYMEYKFNGKTWVHKKKLYEK